MDRHSLARLEQSSVRQRPEHTSPYGEHAVGGDAAYSRDRFPASLLLGRTIFSGRGSGPVHIAAMQHTQSTSGNRAAQRAIQRSTGNVPVQRADNPPPEWWDQAYDDPTPEEWAKLEEMYQKGLAEDATADATAEATAEATTEAATGATEAGEAATMAGEGGGGLLGLAGLPLLAGLGAGAAVMTYSSDTIVGDDEEKAMLEESKWQQATRQAAQGNGNPPAQQPAMGDYNQSNLPEDQAFG